MSFVRRCERPKNRAPTPGASSASPVARTDIRPPKCSFYWRLSSNPTERGDFCSMLLEVLQSVRRSGLPAKRSALCCRMPALGRTTNHYQCGYGAAHGRAGRLESLAQFKSSSGSPGGERHRRSSLHAGRAASPTACRGADRKLRQAIRERFRLDQRRASTSRRNLSRSDRV
jgi:hypothetical protein